MKEEHEGIKFMGVWGGFFLCFFCCTLCHTGSLFPDQGSNPCPLQWKFRVLTTGPPGKSGVVESSPNPGRYVVWDGHESDRWSLTGHWLHRRGVPGSTSLGLSPLARRWHLIPRADVITERVNKGWMTPGPLRQVGGTAGIGDPWQGTLSLGRMIQEGKKCPWYPIPLRGLVGWGLERPSTIQQHWWPQTRAYSEGW